MLDLARLERLKLHRRPLSQRIVGRMLGVNSAWLPGIELELEHAERIPDGSVIYAMNHTDRYIYGPFQYAVWQELDRFTATWVKGKYYESRFIGRFMESMAQLPTVSRGYLITRDFLAVMNRTPTDQEYAMLRRAVDAQAVGEKVELPDPPEIPEMLLRKARNPFGVAYDPRESTWPEYICALFRAMMVRFVELNERAIAIGLDLLIFPQGTRSKRLLPAHIGISQIALHLKIPVVPVGCNGSDGVYPGASPFARRGRIVYRMGEPIHYDELAPFHIDEPFAPFSAMAERDYARQFQGVADIVTERIDGLLDPEYRLDAGAATEAAEKGVHRFV